MSGTGQIELSGRYGLTVERIEKALERARGTRAPALLSATVRWSGLQDPTAVIQASRVAGEPWFSFEQPDRDGFALGGLGSVYAHEARGRSRFGELARRWRRLAADAIAEHQELPPAAGMTLLGGFAFAPEGGGSSSWEGFAPASMHLPEISLARRGEETWLTINLAVDPRDSRESVLARGSERAQSLRERRLPLLDPAPAGRYRVESVMPPSHFEEAVARGVERIAAGELEKLVLAREVEVQAPVAHDPAAILGVLREAFPSCFVFAVGRGESTFLGASPELLIRRDGQRASTVALAGSTRRSADPAVDDHLGEQLLRSEKDREENAIVARRIEKALAPHSVWVTAPREPGLVKVANIQHLGAPIRAQLRSHISAIELAGLLHPTPAVGGEPTAEAMRLIPALEGLDRGWYAGTVGWTDSSGDGEFCVALRCALLRGRSAHCYAGGGIVRDSNPASELAETEIKLQALLPLLAG
ncbi:MAG: isochorismate synthase [Solirubrobacteraceae bacterium]